MRLSPALAGAARSLSSLETSLSRLGMLPALLTWLLFCLIRFLGLSAFPLTLLFGPNLQLHPSIPPTAVARPDQALDILSGASLGHQ